MSNLPIIAKFHQYKLNEILKRFMAVKFLSSETRQNFTGEFPMHTRYFSNGDVPLVALINVFGDALFGYDNNHVHLSAGDFIFFDDSKPHSWVFKNCNLEIFYYRHCDEKGMQITQGDYCLDNYF